MHSADIAATATQWASWLARLAALCIAFPCSPSFANPPSTVYFLSADATTKLVGYVFTPVGGGRHPAVVMLHGRGGPYSSLSNQRCTFVREGEASPCGASTLSQRHVGWGEFWAARGYLALHVDSFGPRGRGHGFAAHSHDDPNRNDVNERTVRPLDAQSALAYLARRDDVLPARIGLQGWSNGASTALNVMSDQAGKQGAEQYRAALAFYPGCGLSAVPSRRYQSDDPILVFLASEDEEVSPAACKEKLSTTRSGSALKVVWYDGATHDFDDPGKKRRSVPANRAATDDAMRQAEAFFADRLAR